MSLPKIYAGHRKRWLWLLVANGSAQALAGVALAYFLREALGVARGETLPWRECLCMTSVGGLILLLRVREARDAERLGQDFVMRVRLRIFDRLVGSPERTARRGRWGVTMTRLTSDLNSLRNWVATGLARAIVASISAVGMLAGLVWMSPRSSVATVVTMALGFLVAGLITPRLRSFVRESRRRRGRLANNLGERILALPTVRGLGRSRAERKKVQRHSTRMADALVRRVGLAAVLRSLPDAATPLAVAGVAIAVAGQPEAANDSVVAILLLGLISSALRDLARSWDHRLAFEEGRRRIDQILEGPRLSNPRQPEALRGKGPLALEFEGVSVEGLFERIDVQVAAGEHVLVTGASGEGKSSFLALAARCFDPDEGEIRVGGIPLPQLRLRTLRSAIQRVSPELPLLSGTVAENVEYGVSDLDPAWLERVGRACGLNGPSGLLPEGLETHIEEGGGNLPAVMRARVALARACAVKPRLLLIDDPIFWADTSAAQVLERIFKIGSFTLLVVVPEREAHGFHGRVLHLGGGRVIEVSKTGTDAPLSLAREPREVA